MSHIKITLPVPPKELSPNARCHHMTKARKTGQYRYDAALAAKSAIRGFKGERFFPIETGVVFISYFHPRRSIPDADNILASLKSAFDGFSDAGLWTDDRDVMYLPVRRAIDRENPRVDLTIFDEVPPDILEIIKSCVRTVSK